LCFCPTIDPVGTASIALLEYGFLIWVIYFPRFGFFFFQSLRTGRCISQASVCWLTWVWVFGCCICCLRCGDDFLFDFVRITAINYPAGTCSIRKLVLYGWETVSWFIIFVVYLVFLTVVLLLLCFCLGKVADGMHEKSRERRGHQDG